MSHEPILPGMEKEVENLLARTQATLDSINFIPLIGIEFTLVLLPFDPTEEPKYLCLLCDQRSDSRTFLQHLISIKHYMSYLQRYFASLASALEQLTNEISEGYQKLVFHVIGKIEETYGRMEPIVINAGLFESSSERISILRRVNNGKHIMESPEDKWMLEMVKPEFLENPILLKDKFPLEKISEKKNLRQEEKPKFTKGKMSIKKNPRTAIHKSHTHTKNDKEDSESDLKFLHIKPCTESKPSSHVSSRDSNKRKCTSPLRRYCRSRNPCRRGSLNRSNFFITSKPMSRSRFPGHSHDHFHSRSHFPYYNQNKYSNVRRQHGSREEDGTSRKQMSPPTTVPPKHSMAYQLRPCSPDMYSAKYHQQKKEREIVNDKLILDIVKSKFVENLALLQGTFSLKKITEKKKHEKEENPKVIKAETCRNRERDGISRRQMSPPPSFHPWHSKLENFPAHHLHSCSTDMDSSKYHQQQKEKSMGKRKRLLQEYEKAVEDIKIKEVKTIRYNDENPEKQPLYVEEWIKFSNQRSKESKMEGKGTNSYTFIPECILLWSKQIQKINDKEINSNIHGDIEKNKSC